MKRSEIVNWIIAIVGLVASVIQIGYFVIDIFDSTQYTARGNDVPTFYLIITGFMTVYGWITASYLLGSRRLKAANINRFIKKVDGATDHRTIRKIAFHSTLPVGILISPIILFWCYGYSHNLYATLFLTGFLIVALIALISNTLSSLLPILRDDIAVEWNDNTFNF